jgi:transcriptional regulator with XRE-family HTH domain
MIEKEGVIKDLGWRLKKFRLEKELRQNEFAIICGTSQNNLSEIENCRRGISDKMLRNLILYFPDFDVNYILTGEKRALKTAVTEGVEH